MSSLYFISGQIAVLESQLLNSGQLDRMIGAKTPEEAFGVMSELSYAKYFDDSLEARDFSMVIENGLKETKELLVDGTDDHRVLHLIWARFDLNNLKRALKERFIEGKDGLGAFTEDNGYSALGRLSAEKIESLVWNPEESNCPLLSVVFKHAQKDVIDIREVEMELDLAYFAFAKKQSKNGLVRSYVQHLIDAHNFRSVLRSVLILESSLDPLIWVEGGSLDRDRFLAVTSLDQFVDLYGTTPFSELLRSAPDSLSGEELLVRVEKILDQYVYGWLGSISLGSDSILRVLYYFEQRLTNARMLKTVMLGKFYGLEVQQIQDKLKHVGH